MNKLLTVALGAAFAAASASAAAADANGAFFINAGIGQAQYHVGRTDGLGFKLDDKDTAGALRFGYAWKVGNGFDLGVEGGYADLGKLVAKYNDGTTFAKTELGAHGWLLGGNGKYRFDGNWFVSARAGWFRSEERMKAFAGDATTGAVTIYDSADDRGNGWYGGVGVGYDFAPNFSLGLNYDNYHAKATLEGASAAGNVGAYTVSAEYRF
ncbi:MAG TPA: outer membrane beta-barrel protein [Frateuria sp.]|uniref:outer membrane beta-barrel protein n=1 Tax=Frateuria sp. TaxID=2211372 RepID=UPI002D7EFCC2|nr:outer membrane beta-barrel protein [Frateuria sp.]HET6804869.1 outer membrane beta-barrel protein [Frateuria sp.]